MFQALIEYIQSIVKANGNEDITGTNMQQVLLQIVDVIGAAEFRGVASPVTDPGVPVGPAIYITATAGDYIHFGNSQVAQGELALLKWSGVVWEKQTITTVVSDIFTREYKGVPFIEHLIKRKGTQETEITILKKVNGVVIGGVVTWTGEGLSYYNSLIIYFANNYSFTLPFEIITLDDADPVFDRIDVIAVNDIGTREVVKGVASAAPIKPQLTYSQLEVTYIIVKAGSTEPAVDQFIIYNENTESIGTAVNIIANFDDSQYPQIGIKDVEALEVQEKGKLTFTLPAPQSLDAFNTLSLFIRLIQNVPTAGKIFARFYLGNLAISDQVPLVLDSVLIDQYQLVAVTLDQFKFTGTQFTKFELQYVGYPFDGFYLDYIKLEGGIANPSAEGWHLDVSDGLRVSRTLIKPGDNVYFKGKNGIKTSRVNDPISGNMVIIELLDNLFLDDIMADYEDIATRDPKTYILDLKASYDYNITSAVFVTDSDTVTGVTVKINNVAIAGLSNLTVDTVIRETNATDPAKVTAGDIVSLSYTSVTGKAAKLILKIKRTR